MLEIQKKLTVPFYAMLSLPATAMGFALSIQIAALSWILTESLNMDLHQMAIVWAAGPIAGILGQVIIGFISDGVWFWGGRRRPFILIGGVIAAIMLLALPNIGLINKFFGGNYLLPVAIIVALTLDLAINISFNPTRSIIADVTPEGEQRTKGYTWMQTISGAFGVLAYVLSVVFNNYVLIYVGVFLVLGFSIIPTLFITENKSLVLPEEKKEATKTQWGDLFKIYFAHGFSWIGVQTMFVFIIAFIKQYLNPADSKATGDIISYSFLILNTIGFILPALVFEPITEKLGRVKTHLLAVAIMAVGYLMIALFARSVTMLYIFMGICGIGWAAIVSLPFAIMTEKINKAKTGLFMGIFNLSVVLPQLFVSLVIGAFMGGQKHFWHPSIMNWPVLAQIEQLFFNIFYTFQDLFIKLGFLKDYEDKTIIFLISAVCLALSAIFWLFVKEQKGNKKAEKVVSSGH